MFNYIIKRLFYLIPIVLGLVTLVFFLLQLVPGDPVRLIAGSDAPEKVIIEITKELGLDQPIYIQYFSFMKRFLRGDLGRSLLSRRPVIVEIFSALPNTLELVLVASLWSVLLAIPVGVIAAIKRGTIIDTISMVIALLGLSLPIFWIGIVLMWYFGVHLGWLPATGRGGPLFTLEGWRHIILPAITLGSFQAAALARLTRSNFLEDLSKDFVRTARSKGLPERVVLCKHVLRNTLLPIVTVIGMQLAYLVGGALVTETVFNWPGMGRLVIGAILSRDFPVVQGVILVTGVAFVIINLLVDLLYTFIDPRVRYN